MLNDEVIRIEAQKGTQNTVLAATAPSPTPPTGSSAAPSQQQPDYSSSSSNRRGSRGRGGSYNRRGRGRGRSQQQPAWNSYQGTPPSFPNWAWWTTPPCPYPTQQPQWNKQAAPQHDAQAHYSAFPSAQFSPYPSGFQQPIYNPMCPTDLAADMANLQVNSPNTGWTSDVMDTGAETHVTNEKGKIHIPDSFPVCRNILVGNGMTLPIKGSGTGFHPLPNRTYILPHILYSPQIVKNLISVRRFTRDNQVSVEFDPFGFSLKDLKTKKTLSRHNSTGTLYTFTPPQLPPQATFIASHHLPWHDRLGHPGAQVLDILNRNFNFQCNKDKSHLCNSCQLSNSKRLPFHLSNMFTFAPFDIIHCDLWTSPITSKT
uniref:Putative GAG-pre-integrase domain-containing protein n=1 Tax=Helianthus annuus TaxID=4232 RepID=A0A251RZM1_HELAN